MLQVGLAVRRWVFGFPGILLLCLGCLKPSPSIIAAEDTPEARIQKRWLFVWRDMSNPEEVERMIARFPRAAAAGYNGVVFSYNVAPTKAARLREAAKQNGMDRI